jgi:DNA recombination protein RmuC
MSFDPNSFAVVFSVIAALMATWAAFRPIKIGGQLDPLARSISESYERVREALSAETSRGRAEDEQRGRILREEVLKSLSIGLNSIGQSSQALREEITKQVGVLGETVSSSVSNLGTVQTERLEGVVQQVNSLGAANERRLMEMRAEGQETGKSLRDEVTSQLQALSAVVAQSLSTGSEAQRERLEGIANEIGNLTRRNTEQSETLRQIVEAKLASLQEDNAARLEQMRLTVDEKLQHTLEQRLTTSFKLVSDQLENVFRSVGEMQTLAAGVGDLKRVLTNVKNRGTWAEVSLGNLLEQIMAPEQFERGVEVRPSSGERVDFAIKLPGTGSDTPVWLPIDAKFPTEDYERLVDASERGDPVDTEIALKGIEQRIRTEGASICEKYICPPFTTDFAILYLPTEGLYAEVIRRSGLVDDLQRNCRIVIAGPTVLLATLNSLRMGFRTLAIQKRSSEVWELLSAVKTEFSKYGTVLDRVQKKLTEASNQIDLVTRRKKAIDRRLRGVEEATEQQAEQLLELGTANDLLDDPEPDESEMAG